MDMCGGFHTLHSFVPTAESGGVQVQEKWNEVEKILAPLVAAQEWQMGSKQTGKSFFYSCIYIQTHTFNYVVEHTMWSV